MQETKATRPTAAREAAAVPRAEQVKRAGWLRAAVLGADDGIVSTASLIVGVAAANASTTAVLTAGIAGLVAGAASMAAGEYVSVSSQRDLEEAMLGRERSKIAVYPEVALTELAIVLQLRGIDPGLARRVAEQLSVADPVGANARDILGITEETRARPLQAALASAASFALGSLVPLGGMIVGAAWLRIPLAVILALVALAASGAVAAEAGGAPRGRAALRVVAGGGLAMALSALVGRLVGIAL
jgi:VIT1/CCC1 family predicted Fe2+/Mn2+ transporter